MKQPTLFDGARRTLQDSIQSTIESLTAYGAIYDHWAIAWSGGKDSTTAVTVTLHLIDSGTVPSPKSLTIFYADTRLELTPLATSALGMINQMRQRGVDVQVVMAPLDERFMVYLLGRGVPPPNNNTLRWCTEAIKIKPMRVAVEAHAARLGKKFLMLTGLRIGESASRDARIAVSCGVNGGECGQGWYQVALPQAAADTLSPVLHWRVCHVWEWLKILAPSKRYGGWDTQLLADAYGGDEAEEHNARTGCVGCPLANRDTALDGVIAQEAWKYLAPLKELRPLWRELRKPIHRLRKPGGECRKDGSLVRNQNRMGPIALESRLMALDEVLNIQQRINFKAQQLGRPMIDVLNVTEEHRIRELIDLRTFPNKWSGNEPSAAELYVPHFADGTAQQLIFGA